MKRFSLFALALLFLTSCKAANGSGSIDWHPTLALIIIICIILTFFVLALFSNMLRDTVNDCDTFDAHADALKAQKGDHYVPRAPYSLSRVSLAVWTVVISCSFTYLALCIADCTVAGVNQTALILMGMGAGVAAASSVIDQRDISTGKVRHQNLPSKGFFIDILSDNNGISIHRFQNVVWTVIGIVIYLNKVYFTKSGCDLPELSQTLLILMGISSTTYVALKANENNVPATQQPTQDPIPNPVPAPMPAPNPVPAPPMPPVPAPSVPPAPPAPVPVDVPVTPPPAPTSPAEPESGSPQ